MSAANAAPVELKCSDCAGSLGHDIYCPACADHGDCMSASNWTLEQQSRMTVSVIEWAERQRLLFGMPKETWELFMQCAKELGSG